MKHIFTLCNLIFITMLCTCPKVGAAEPDLFDLAEPSFIRVDTGSNEVSIYEMVIADSGRLWLATLTGIFYYDGYNYTALDYLDSNGNTYNNYITSGIVKADDGILWASSYSQGLFRIDEKSRSFTNFPHNPTDNTSLLNNRLTDVLLDGNKGLWVSSFAGLSYLNFNDLKFTNYPLPEELVLEGVKSLSYDALGKLFVGTIDGLFYFDVTTKKFSKVETQGPSNLDGIFIAEMVFDDRGRLWLGTVSTGAFLLHPDKTLEHLGNYGWVQDLKIVGNEVWMASGGRGIVTVDFETGKHKRDYQSDLYRPMAMETNDLTELFVDDTGVVWVSAWKNGLWMLPPSRDYARSLMYTPSKEAPPSKADVSSAIETDDGEIWVASKSQGVDIFDPVKGYLRTLSTDTVPSLPSKLIDYIYKSRDGTIWLGTNDKGVWAMTHGRKNEDVASKEFTWALNKCLKGSKELALSMPVINEPGGKGVVVYSYLDGLHRGYLDDNGQCQLKRININTDRIIINGAAINQDAGVLLDADEFHILPNDSDTARKLKVVLENNNQASPPEFESVQTTPGGQVFFHTGEELYEKVKLEGDTLYLKKIFESNQNPAIFHADKKGNIWGAGGYRLAKDDVFRAWAESDGYSSENGIFSNAWVMASGTAIAAYSRGLKLFRTGDFKPWNHVPKIILQEASIDGVNVVGAHDGLTLKANNSDFTLKFAAIDFTGPDAILYRYFLDGYSKEWVTTDASQRFASYTNLVPGEYTFRLQSTNRLGVWSGKEMTLLITVLPAWYQTWPFRFAMALLIFLSLYWIYLWRLSYYRQKKAELEQLVHERTVDLEKSMMDLKSTQKKLVASEKQASLGRLVSGVAHEINTPLGVVKMAFSTAQSSAMELFQAFKIDTIQDKPVLTRFKKFQTSAAMLENNFQRLSNLVSSFKDISVNDDEWTLQACDVGQISRDVCDLYRARALAQSIEIDISVDEEMQIRSYPELLAEVLSGLIENSIQHGFSDRNGGNIHVRVFIEVSKESPLSKNIIIQVYDNGIGIPEPLLKTIFDPFTAQKPSNIGLGLHVITNRVNNILKGEISCENLQEGGCRFTVTIPVLI